MHQKSCLTSKTLLIMFLSTPIFLFRPAQAQEYPELNPPKVERERETEYVARKEIKAETPSTEWTLHKTTDGLHPDGNEQAFMWFMNRARNDPTAEGIWLATMDDPDVDAARDYFGVDLLVLQDEFADLEVKPPAAFDARLYDAARQHSEYLISIDDQNHDGQFDRVDASGFVYWAARGNVFSYTKTSVHGHAAFNIDWGTSGDGSGMQDGRGHRAAIMAIDGDYTNVGIAAVPETDPLTDVGPLVVTGNYCSANTGIVDHFNRFIVGTVWQDMDGDSMYDPGEGIGGVTVTPDQGTYYAVTGTAGGYAIPILSSGSYEVRLSGSGIPSGLSETISVGEESVLLDFQALSEKPAMPFIPLLLLDD